MTQDFRERLRAIIDVRLKAAGISRTDVGSAMGVSEGLVSRIINGRVDTMRFDDGLRFCEKYGVDPWLLVFGRARREPSSADGTAPPFVPQEDFLTLRQEFDNLRLGLGLATGKVQRAVELKDQRLGANPPKTRGSSPGHHPRRRKAK